MTNELWRDIPGYPGYQASNFGRLRTLDKLVNSSRGKRTIKGKILSPYEAKGTGYLHICINRKNVAAHRLVALAWCVGYADGLWVDHLNGIRTDNRPENLEWVTPSQNGQRPYALGRRAAPYAGKFSDEHNTSKAVIAKNLVTGAERHFPSAMDAVREGFESSSISRCCTGKAAHHKGHTWKFAFGAQHSVEWSDPKGKAA